MLPSCRAAAHCHEWESVLLVDRVASVETGRIDAALMQQADLLDITGKVAQMTTTAFADWCSRVSCDRHHARNQVARRISRNSDQIQSLYTCIIYM